MVTVAVALPAQAAHHRRQNATSSHLRGRGYRFVLPFERRESSDHVPLDLDVAADTGLNLVGRGRQLASLRGALTRASTGRGRLCTLMGEPGIGKTYLVEALEQGLAHGQAGVAWGFCREAGDTPPLGPWLRLLREVKATAQRLGARWLDDPRVAELDALLHGLAMRELEGASLVDVIDHIAVQGPSRHRLFDLIVSFLALASKQTPWLLVLEDLHRADEASIELLHHLLDELMRMRILVVGTCARPKRSGPALSLVPATATVAHTLTGCAASRRDYVRAQLDDLDGELGRAIFEKSEAILLHGRAHPPQLASGSVDHGRDAVPRSRSTSLGSTSRGSTQRPATCCRRRGDRP